MQENKMTKIRLGPGFTVFIIFFGVSLTEAITSGSVMLILFWLLMGAIFFLADQRTSNDSGKT